MDNTVNLQRASYGYAHPGWQIIDNSDEGDNLRRWKLERWNGEGYEHIDYCRTLNQCRSVIANYPIALRSRLLAIFAEHEGEPVWIAYLTQRTKTLKRYVVTELAKLVAEGRVIEYYEGDLRCFTAAEGVPADWKGA
jgi:hypothetical protein